MKKKIILLTLVILSAVSANAVDWKEIQTEIPNFSIYIDGDSIKCNNQQECLYAIKFQTSRRPETVAYLKSCFKRRHQAQGIIRTDDYSELNYRPRAVFANAHVFMKPLDNDSFLKYAHEYVEQFVPAKKRAPKKEVQNVQMQNNADVPEKQPAADTDSDRPEIRGLETSVQVEKSENVEYSNFEADLKGYTLKVRNLLEDNWYPPKSGKNSEAIIILTIGKDGSLQKYHIAQSSGDETTDRSIVNAAEQSVPYPKFPKSYKSVYPLKIQFVFNYKMLKKSVT